MRLDAGLRRESVQKWLHIDVAHRPAERRVRLSLDGHLDVLSAPDLITALIGVLHDLVSVELDLSALTCLDAAGIRCLLICRGAAMDAGLALILVAPAPEVARVLRIAGLQEMVAGPPAVRA